MLRFSTIHTEALTQEDVDGFRRLDGVGDGGTTRPFLMDQPRLFGHEELVDVVLRPPLNDTPEALAHRFYQLLQ